METDFNPADPAYAERVAASFARQGIMSLIGAELASVAPGRVDIRLPFREDLSQQHGFFHAGVVSTIVDSAGGYAAYSLFAAEESVLTVEFKINLVAPAAPPELHAIGQVVKPGRTLTLCDLEVFSRGPKGDKLVAKGLQTIMRIAPRPDIAAAG